MANQAVALARRLSPKRRVEVTAQFAISLLCAAIGIVIQLTWYPLQHPFVFLAFVLISHVFLLIKVVLPSWRGEASLLFVSTEALEKAGKSDTQEKFYLDKARRPQNTNEPSTLGVSETVMIDLRRGRAFCCKRLEDRWLLDKSVQFRPKFYTAGDFDWYECEVKLPKLRRWYVISYRQLQYLLLNLNVDSFEDTALLRDVVEKHWINQSAQAARQRYLDEYCAETKKVTEMREKLAQSEETQRVLAFQLLAAMVGLTIRERGGLVQQRLRNAIAVEHGPLMGEVLGKLYNVEWLLKELKKIQVDERVNEDLAMVLYGYKQEMIQRELYERFRQGEAEKAPDQGPLPAQP